MSKRIDAVTLNDMLEHARRIVEWTSDTRETFANDDMLTAAVSLRLVWLATAAERVTPAGKRGDIPWEEIARAGDRVLHEYYDVTPAEVWRRARTVAPKVIEALASR